MVQLMKLIKLLTYKYNLKENSKTHRYIINYINQDHLPKNYMELFENASSSE